MSNVNTVVFTIVLVLFVIVTVVGFAAAPLAARGEHDAPERVGAGGPRLRHVHHVVPARRRPLHRLHVHRRACAGVRLGFDRLLRGLLHDHGVPDRVHLPAQAVVGLPGAQLGHARRLHPGQVRLTRAGARHGLHRHSRADAVYRAAARRHPVGAHRHGGRRQLDQHLRQGPAAVRRVRGAGDLHVRLRAARACRDRVHQGHAHLRVRHRGRVLHPDQAGRLGTHLRHCADALRVDQPGDEEAARHVHPHHASPPAAPSSTSRRWRSAPPSRCSCTRTSSPARWPPSGAA